MNFSQDDQTEIRKKGLTYKIMPKRADRENDFQKKRVWNGAFLSLVIIFRSYQFCILNFNFLQQVPIKSSNLRRDILFERAKAPK